MRLSDRDRPERHKVVSSDVDVNGHFSVASSLEI